MRRTIIIALALVLGLSTAVGLRAADAGQPIPFERGSWASAAPRMPAGRRSSTSGA